MGALRDRSCVGGRWAGGPSGEPARRLLARHVDAATREPTRDLWTLVGGDPAVIGMYEADIGVALDQDALDLYRLCWDLTEIALYLSDLRHPHERTDDTDTAWRGLQEYLGPGRGRTG